MKNLCKKISVLLVLAMLVGMFSGVTSASAASKWSFSIAKTDKVVQVGEMIEMQPDEFAAFELRKAGKKVKASAYTVTWKSSNQDVIWINAKNGKARAAREVPEKELAELYGKTATVSATFTNVKTKESATRSFTVKLVAPEQSGTPELYFQGDMDSCKLNLVFDQNVTLTEENVWNGEFYSNNQLLYNITLDGIERWMSYELIRSYSPFGEGYDVIKIDDNTYAFSYGYSYDDEFRGSIRVKKNLEGHGEYLGIVIEAKENEFEVTENEWGDKVYSFDSEQLKQLVKAALPVSIEDITEK